MEFHKSYAEENGGGEGGVSLHVFVTQSEMVLGS